MDCDIAIVGAGPAGLALARALADTGLHIILVERQSQEQLADPAFDGRDIALTHLSRRLLRRLGAWEHIAPAEIAPLQCARVLDGDSSQTLDFGDAHAEAEPLGWLVANHLIRKALYEVTAALDRVELRCGTAVEQVATNADGVRLALADGTTLRAHLLVGADTRFSVTRRQMGIGAAMKDFGRVAIVCRMRHELAHEHTAWECFHYGRTLAILPMPGDASSIVITVPADQAQAILEQEPAAFEAEVAQRFGHRLGSMRLASERMAYPLVAVHADRFVARRFALIGDAAVGMHPVTAHGFNLGLSGVDLLAGEVRRQWQRGADIASPAALARYQSRHRLATLPLFHGTNGIVGLFTDDRLPARLARKAVLHLSERLPPVRWAIRHKLISREHVGGPLLALLP
jgi:ubiquinone biosynthesis UbiH/UbiF/VisC/COQ6 family hydroxylase